SVRALAVTGGGGMLGARTPPLRRHRDGARDEQDSARWWTAAPAACAAPPGGAAPAVGRGGAGGGTPRTALLGSHAAARPATPRLMYDDTRAATEVDRVNEAGATVWTALGYRRMQPSWALPKLLWLLREHPELARGTRVASQVDVINRAL